MPFNMAWFKAQEEKKKAAELASKQKEQSAELEIPKNSTKDSKFSVATK